MEQIRRYVAFLPGGSSPGCLKKIVLVNVVLSFYRPWHRRANSLEQPSCHLSLNCVDQVAIFEEFPGDRVKDFIEFVGRWD